MALLHTDIAYSVPEQELKPVTIINHDLKENNGSKMQVEIRKFDEVIHQYQNNGKAMSDEIIKFARLAYDNGEIDYFQYIQSLENAATIELDYLDNLNNYNQAVLELNYLNL